MCFYWLFVLSMFVDRSTHSLMFKLIVLMSINVFKIVDILLLIMNLIELLISRIYFTSIIFRRLYTCRELIISIMNYFFCVVSSLIKQSYNDFESVQNTNEMRRSRMLNNVALKLLRDSNYKRRRTISLRKRFEFRVCIWLTNNKQR